MIIGVYASENPAPSPPPPPPQPRPVIPIDRPTPIKRDIPPERKNKTEFSEITPQN